MEARLEWHVALPRTSTQGPGGAPMLEALQWIECAQGLDEEGAGQRCPSST